MNSNSMIRRAAWLLALTIVLAAPAPAQGPGALAGRVVTTAGDAVTDARVTLVDLRRRVQVDGEGRFRFSGVPAGDYLLEAESPTFGKGSTRIAVAPGREAEATLTLDVAVLRDEVVVSAPGVRRQLEVAQPTSVLTGEDLDQRRQATLGETLSAEPGVSSTYFGPGASRPVIRGLGGDRIRTLQEGLGTADAGNLSPDHAVSVDPLSAERIEVLRGPATLLYGSTAVGGVVNVFDGRIPEVRPEVPLSGSVEVDGATAADERAGALVLTGGAGRLAWHADFMARETDDYEIPGFAEAGHGEEEEEEEGEEEAFGVLPNSALESEAGGVGLSWIGDGALLGLSVSGFDTLYGVPGGHGHGEEEEGEEAIRIDLAQRRVDLKGDVLRPFGAFRGARLRFGYADYEHDELEGSEIGTRFTNDSWEGRFELVQKERGNLTGSVGAQVSFSDFAAIGEEAFVPPSETLSAALFTFEELSFADGRWRLQLGGRYERQDVEPEADLPDRTFDGLSGSVGLLWEPNEDYSAALSVARSERLPTANELYADGPHAATRAFEIGDPDLGKETSLGVDLSLRKRTGRVSATLNLFANRFDDYVFERFTGEVEDGLDVVVFEQEDAEFRGAEVEALVSLFERGGSHLDLELSGDYVRAELADTGEPLPRIPPVSYGLGLHYHRQQLRAWTEVRRAEEQDRLSANETATGGHTLVSAGASYRFFVAGRVLDVMLRGRNLTDEEARNHVSFLKDVAPLPGRDVSLGVRFSF